MISPVGIVRKNDGPSFSAAVEQHRAQLVFDVATGREDADAREDARDRRPPLTAKIVTRRCAVAAAQLDGGVDGVADQEVAASPSALAAR